MTAPDPTRWTSIGRPLDPSWPTNRAVLLLLVPAAMVGAALSPAGPLVGGLLGAGAAFAGWALTREMAPDDDPAAFVALVGAVAPVAAGVRPGLLPVFVLLLLARIVNRTVGPPARLLDTVAAAGITAWAVATGGNWPVAAAATAAFALDARLPGTAPRRHVAVAVAFGAWAAHGLATAPRPELPGLLPGALAALAGGLYLRALVRTRVVTAPTDTGVGRLSPARVRGGMALPLVVLAPGLVGQGAAPATLAVVWATVAAVGFAALRPGLPANT